MVDNYRSAKLTWRPLLVIYGYRTFKREYCFTSLSAHWGISWQREARSRDYALLLFRMTSRVLLNAQYHEQHCTLHPFEQFGARYECLRTLWNLKSYEIFRSPTPFIDTILASELPTMGAECSNQLTCSRIHINRGEWFSPNSQSILNQLSLNFTSTIFLSRRDHPENLCKNAVKKCRPL